MIGRVADAQWQDRRRDGSLFISGKTLSHHDLDRLRTTRYLTFLDTRVPEDFFSALPQLELLDLRGSKSVAGVAQIGKLTRLRRLKVCHARGHIDLSVLGELKALEFLDLYALSGLTSLPEMTELNRLRRVNLGQMIRLTDWTALTGLPALESLELSNKLTPDLEVLARLASRSTFQSFMWSAPDESRRKVDAAAHAASRPKPEYVRITDLWPASRLRFVAPPNWPAAPNGWAPPEGWEPDSTWPPAPKGWEFWQLPK
jgi:hypothetical protein